MLQDRTINAGKRKPRVYGFGVLLLIPAIAALMISGCSRAEKGAGVPLAQVGGTAIYRDALDKKMRELSWKLGLPDNGETRNDLLNGMISEELLLQDARSRGYDKDPSAKQYRKTIEPKILIDEYSQKYILPSITVSEDELKTLFKRFNTKVEARHLFAQTFAQAESYKERLLTGESFEEIAREVFTDPVLRDNGGKLEPFTVDDMDPAFEEVAFSQPLFAISDPVKLKHGYSIIQVLKRATAPLLTEQQYLEKHDKLETYLRSRKRPLAYQQHADSIRDNVLKLQFDPDLLNRLYDTFQTSQTAEGPLPASIRAGLDPEFASQTLITKANGKISIGEAVDLLGRATDREMGWVGSADDLKASISGLLIREYILRKAHQEKLDRSESFKNELNEEMDLYMLRRIGEEIVETAPLPEDSLREFYTRNEVMFNRPEAILLSGIQVENADQAETILQRLTDGEDFAQLARQYSLHAASSARGGELGMFTKSNLGPDVAGVWDLARGEWIGPLAMNDGAIGFFRVDERYPAHQQAFEEATDEVAREYRKNFGQQILAEHIETLKRQTKISVNEELLKAPLTKGEGVL